MSISASVKPVTGRTRIVHRGQSLLLLSAVAFSTAGFFTRQAPVNLWAMVFWRNGFGIAALLLMLLAAPKTFGRLDYRLNRREWVVIASSSFGTICYLAAFAYTSVANISIIYATAPMITAAMARLWLRETMSRKTLAAASVALIGVGFTVSGSLRAGTAFGDCLALMMTVSLSVMAVAARGTALSAAPTALIASMLAAWFVPPLGWIESASFLIGWRDAAWLAGFGIVTMAVALPCYLLGAADVPAGKAMLISALEMPLAPLWVWLAFGETASSASLVGGVIVTLAVLSDLAGARPCAQSIDSSSAASRIAERFGGATFIRLHGMISSCRRISSCQRTRSCRRNGRSP
jgi:drug/metabolite transporter (DMT)-like permease